MLARNNKNTPRTLSRPLVTARGGERGVTYRSGDAHVQYWIGTDIPIEFYAERLLSAYRAWTTVSDGGLPCLSEMTNSDADAAANDSLLFLKVDSDYLVVSQGTDHLRHIGTDLRGRKLSEFDVPVSHAMKELHDICLTDKQAVYARFVSDLAPDSVYWEGLFVPLQADNGGHQLFVMTYSMPIDNKADIYQMILDRAPIGMIAAIPLGETRGSIDGRVVLINARAKKLLKFDEKGSRVHYIRELVPWLRDVTGWTRTGITNKGQKTIIRYRDKTNNEFSVTMEALKRFVLFSIFEIGEAREPLPAGAGAGSQAAHSTHAAKAAVPAID